MSSYNIDEDQYYQTIMNGGDVSSPDSWGSAGDSYGSQSGGDFNFANHSNTTGGTSAAPEAEDEFGDLEVPEGGFGEPQTYEEMLGKPKPTEENDQQESSSVRGKTLEMQELQQALDATREENANLLCQVKAAPKPWATSFIDLPKGDPVFLEVDGMLSNASRNHDTLKGNAEFLQNQLNSALEANARLQASLNDMSSAPNPLEADFNKAIAANRRLQTTIDNLNSAPNPLQAQLDEAVAVSGSLQSTIDALNSAPNPLDGELKSKSQEIEDLRKEIQRLTSSESNFKKQAEELETQLSSATQQVKNLQQVIDKNTAAADKSLKAKQDALNTAEWKLTVATRKVETLEKEVRKPQAENELFLEETIREVREENKNLKCANFKLFEDGKKEFGRLRDANLRLALKLDEPSRNIYLAQAQLTVQKLEREASATLASAEEKKEEEEDEDNEEGTLDTVPGGWTENHIDTDPSLPSSADLLAALTASIEGSIKRKVEYGKEAALHVKFTARFVWREIKNSLFWLFLLVILFLSVFGREVFDDRTPVVETVVEDVPTSSASPWVVAGVVLFLAFLVALYRYWSERKAGTERLEREEADSQLWAAVQADNLATQQAEQGAKQRATERWQESARRVPPCYFESLRSGWTPPRRNYHGNSL
ncbi:hypothetical protein BKA64DRAFT_701475 [Cadophora sp. MPI-SDFR-AT-0126]|nr:hypothetical protein BKA64DRAFT_701475 [Leotiomycetes sp. MPI-SDFR-AT-0126]